MSPKLPFTTFLPATYLKARIWMQLMIFSNTLFQVLGLCLGGSLAMMGLQILWHNFSR